MTTWEWVSAVITIAIMAILAFVFSAVLSACSPVQCVKPVVTLTEPVLPTVMSAELECLAPDVYERLALRDLELQGALRECRAVVEELSE